MQCKTEVAHEPLFNSKVFKVLVCSYLTPFLYYFSWNIVKYRLLKVLQVQRSVATVMNIHFFHFFTEEKNYRKLLKIKSSICVCAQNTNVIFCCCCLFQLFFSEAEIGIKVSFQTNVKTWPRNTEDPRDKVCQQFHL